MISFFMLTILLLPIPVFADIKESVTQSSNNIAEFVRNVSGAVAIAIFGGALLANMLPSVEISQAAKKVMWRVGISVIGITLVSQIVAWLQSLGQ
ncbi:hypothetical protein [Enterococcus columbae]|nr:hypothetical protein [Enterococcus columbae]